MCPSVYPSVCLYVCRYVCNLYRFLTSTHSLIRSEWVDGGGRRRVWVGRAVREGRRKEKKCERRRHPPSLCCCSSTHTSHTSHSIMQTRTSTDSCSRTVRVLGTHTRPSAGSTAAETLASDELSWAEMQGKGKSLSRHTYRLEQYSHSLYSRLSTLFSSVEFGRI